MDNNMNQGFWQRNRRLARWLIPNPATIVLLILFSFAVPSLAKRGESGVSNISISTIPYQGRLASADGTPITDQQNMEFRLYDVPVGGTILWEEYWTGSSSVAVSDGLFSVMLGSLNTDLTNVVQTHNNLYLGVMVGTDLEMEPRVQLGSVPFSIWALSVADGSITTVKLADDAVTTDKIAAGAVGNGDLAADAVSTDKIVDGGVGTDDLASDAVTTDKIVDNAVENNELATNAVSTEKIQDGAVNTNDLANSSITTSKLADNSVTEQKVSGVVVTGGDNLLIQYQNRHSVQGTSTTIVFPQAFGSVPSVVTTADTGAVQNVTVRDISNTQFVVEITDISGNVAINWIAIGSR